MPAIPMQLLKRGGGNLALDINQPTDVDFHITDEGSDWLWAAFCVFMVFALLANGLMYRKQIKERPFYYTTVVPAYVLAIAYFAYASDLGWAPVQAEFNHVTTSDQSDTPGYRQIWYCKYIGWFIAFPFPVINLGLLTRTPTIHIAYNVFNTEVFVVMFLIGSLVHSTYKWGFYVFGISGYIAVVCSLFTTSRIRSADVGKDCQFYFRWLASIFCFLWFIYPIAWGLSEGGNVIQPDSEAVFYGVLDVCTFVFYPLAFFIATFDLNLERLGLIKPDYQVNGEKGAAAMSARASGETAVHHSPSVTPASRPASTPTSPNPVAHP